MEILWWLAPPVLATGLAMVWVSWLGREGRGQVDPDLAVRRLGDAMARPTSAPRGATDRAVRREDRSTGVAVRPSGPTEVSGDAGDTRRAS